MEFGSLPRATASALVRGVLAACVALALSVTVTACAQRPSSEGDARAHRAAEQIADDIGSHSENAPRITLLEMVAWWVPEGPVPTGDGTAIVEPLAWSGESAGSSAAIDIRVIVDVEGHQSNQLFGDSWGPGSATRCFRLEWRQYEPARRSEIPCPEGPAPERPVPAARPELTDVDRQQITTIVGAHTDADALADALREAYPQDYISIETTEADGGIVAAVGIPAERDCVLVFRGADGAITYPSFRRISLEPGEMGCSTGLYTSPPF